MKHKNLRRSAAGVMTGLMCMMSVPALPAAVYNTSVAYAASAGQTFSVGNGQNQHKGDNVDGYSYEIWLDNTGGSGSMTLGSGGSFNTEWSAQVSAGNFLARRGRNYDASKKATQYGTIVMDYAAEYSASAAGNSRLCVYGWMKDPLVEYYIIEDWVNWCPSAQGGAKTVTIDGAQYEIFQLDHTGPTILGDTRTFKQYFSVRKQKRTSGTITVSDHFKAWADAGWNIGNLTEVALNVEGWESSGKANVSKLTIGSEGGGGGAVTVETPQNTDTQGGGNQGGFDFGNMGGGQGGFDFGNMGGNQGGFDFGNMGGNQGGFDFGNMGGGQGGFDWGNMGGGQGGFDFGGMGGGQGGFDFGGMGGFGGFGGDQGGNQGGIDWGGMAGGFNTGGNANIGSDAGNGGNAKSGLNAQIKNDMPTTVPAGSEKTGACKVEKKTYNCKFTGGQKSCNVILPPNYSTSKKYPVMYVLHGIGGDENSMVSGMGVQELMAGLSAKGEAEEMIIVLPSQYTSKTGNGGGGFGINQETCAAYDNFLYDISDSLIDFIEQNYSVKPGRENRAITGFSMGGREAIYIGLMRPDLFAYVGGACPAPGIVPGKDMFMEHPGCMTESEMKFRDVGPEPDVFMITGGTNDSVVGTFPKEYSDILTRNGVEHVYQSIPGGGHDANSVKPHLYTFMRYAFKGSSGASAGGSTVTTAAPQTNTTTTSKAVTTTTATTTSGGGFDFVNFGGGNQAGQADFSSKVSKWGDANVDDTVSMADAVIIMQSLANPSSFKLTDQGKINGDVYQAGTGITNQDAASIQKFLLGLIKNLPESYAENTTPAATTTKQATTTTTKATTAATTTTTQAAQMGGFDMGQFGGQGGFDFSQMGGQGGFDFSQMGGQGGFDFSQMGGQGGFDFSQMGGQGGFDFSQMGGQGGFDMSQMGNFDWGNGGVTIDNNQPAQTTVNTAVQTTGAQDLSGKKLVAISFDDGASATSRQDPAYRIMDALIKNNFHATFFYVSDWIKTNEQVKFAYENGMEVANHTKSHPSLGSLGADQIRSEWEQCNSKLKSIIGTEPSHLMRLPYLDGGGQVKTALYDVPLISCGVDTKDWDGASADQIVNTIKSAAQNGSLQNQIVLCHENYASTAQAMETVLPWLKENGWEVVTVSDMFKANGKQLQGGQIYTRS